MDAFINIIRQNIDVVLVAVIWLGIVFIYILRKKKQLESEFNRRKAAEDNELARQSKGRLTSLDAMIAGENGATEEGALPSNPPGQPIPQTSSHPSNPALQSPPPATPATSAPSPTATATPAPANSPSPQHLAPSPAPQPKSQASQEAAALLTQYVEGDGGGVEEMERMLERDPNNLQLLDWLAFMYYSNNSIVKAVETYSRIIQIDPNNASQHYYLGNCYFKHGEPQKALEEWKAVIALKPNSKYARKAQERISKLG